MSPNTINVSNIAPTTTKAHLNDFFTFCGKITSIDFNEATKSATIAFEKPNAAKTALMLNGGSLDGSTLSVTSDAVHVDEDHTTSEHPYDQSDKPRAGIAAEYLAKGYILSDQVLHKAIEMDQKQGISARFLSYFNSLDKTVGERALGPEKTLSSKVQETVGSATQQAKALDEQKGISKTVNDYYSRAISSPLGQKVFAFYTSTSKQVTDIHEEALRIKELEKSKAAPATSAETSHPPAAGSAAIPAPTTQAAPTIV